MKRRSKKCKLIEIEELYGLELPIILPGDDVPDAPDGVSYYTPDGKRMTGDFADNARQAAKLVLPNLMRSETFYRQGVPIHVSTTYLGCNFNYGLRIPLFWETAVFVGDSVPFTQRYASRAAAKAGHHTIVRTIRESQRRRRMMSNIQKRVLYEDQMNRYTVLVALANAPADGY